jgi:hypothetical protein
VIVGGRITAHDGVLEQTGADAIAHSMADAVAFAHAHRAAASDPRPG